MKLWAIRYQTFFRMKFTINSIFPFVTTRICLEQMYYKNIDSSDMQWLNADVVNQILPFS